MNSSTSSTTQTGKVEAHKVSIHARMGTLPRHFGKHMILVEAQIYDLLHQFSPQYRGGYWEFYELSNGGFFMTPPETTYQITVHGNHYEGQMSAEAAGITVCLFCFGLLACAYPGVDTFAKHFHRLRDYAISHVESAKIFAAID